jgi:hypothetical protein
VRVPELPVDAAGMGLCRSPMGLEVGVYMRLGGPVPGGVDSALNVWRITPLRCVRYGHSLATDGDSMLVTSTGNDSVVPVTWDSAVEACRGGILVRGLKCG